MPSQRLCFVGFELHPAERRLLVGGRTVALGARAFDVLLALAERRGRVVSKAELLEAAWPGLAVEENNLAVQISTLRKLLGPERIATVAGRGYQFTGEPLPDQAQGQTPQPSAVAPTTAATASHLPAPTAQATAATLAAAGNLPLQRQPLIGRDTELQMLRKLVTTLPVTTVVGAGGMGKTTLALATAQAVAGDFEEGAWLVELAPLTDATQIVPAIIKALRITTDGQGPPERQLAIALRSRELLLVLDNCEQLVDAVGALVTTLLATAAKLRVLVTSQDPLQIAGEHLLRVEPLAAPREGEPARADLHSAVALFIARARAVDPQFALHDGNAAAVGELCRRLDGMPLAIELAAARVRLLGVQGLLDRIDERLRVLTGGSRAALPRHQTLAAMLAWSHSLLGPVEQVVLRRLAVFVGSFALARAQDVAADDQIDRWAVLDALGVLVNKSLVTADDADPPRYRLLESTRAFALERAAASRRDAGDASTACSGPARAVCRHRRGTLWRARPPGHRRTHGNAGP